jgi:hydroxymethylpyrimidine/phosphomethylpyrimidine kinase
MSRPEVPVCLTIGTSDSSGGAGVAGDVKAFASIGCFAATVIVGVTAQSPGGVRDRWPVPADGIEAQLSVVTTELPISAVKIGTTWNADVLTRLHRGLAGVVDQRIPIVVDPVMVTASGSSLSENGVHDAIVEHLLPLAIVLTPNWQEACALAKVEPASGLSRRNIAEAICGLGASAVVIGARPEDDGDWFFDGAHHVEIEHSRHPSAADHGAGCAHSALITGLLAQRWELRDAVREAGKRAASGIENGIMNVGRDVHPVDVLGLAQRGCPPRHRNE